MAKAKETIEAPKIDGLQTGRIVHYIDDGAVHRVAIITWIWDDSGAVNLYLFDDGVHPLPSPILRSIRFDENLTPRSWHFLERV